MMRAKLRVTKVERVSDTQENLYFSAVSASEYPADGSDENNTYSKFTPMAELTMMITNPSLLGKFNTEQQFYVDFYPCK